jgi:hypothetical protein
MCIYVGDVTILSISICMLRFCFFLASNLRAEIV